MEFARIPSMISAVNGILANSTTLELTSDRALGSGLSRWFMSAFRQAEPDLLVRLQERGPHVTFGLFSGGGPLVDKRIVVGSIRIDPRDQRDPLAGAELQLVAVQSIVQQYADQRTLVRTELHRSRDIGIREPVGAGNQKFPALRLARARSEQGVIRLQQTVGSPRRRQIESSIRFVVPAYSGNSAQVNAETSSCARPNRLQPKRKTRYPSAAPSMIWKRARW